MSIQMALANLLNAKLDSNMSDLARACKVTPQAVQQWLNGTTVPRGTRLEAIAKYFGLTPLELAVLAVEVDEYILQGMISGQHTRNKLAHSEPANFDTSKGQLEPSDQVVLELLDMGAPSPFRGLALKERDAYQMFGGRDMESMCMAFMPDDGMQPTIELGELLFVEKPILAFIADVRDGIHVLATRNGTRMVKRLQRVGNTIAVKSDNPLYETWYLDESNKDEVASLGRVVKTLPMKMKSFA